MEESASRFSPYPSLAYGKQCMTLQTAWCLPIKAGFQNIHVLGLGRFRLEKTNSLLQTR